MIMVTRSVFRVDYAFYYIFYFIAKMTSSRLWTYFPNISHQFLFRFGPFVQTIMHIICLKTFLFILFVFWQWTSATRWNVTLVPACTWMGILIAYVPIATHMAETAKVCLFRYLLGLNMICLFRVWQPILHIDKYGQTRQKLRKYVIFDAFYFYFEVI